MKILVVDDSALDRKLLIRTLIQLDLHSLKSTYIKDLSNLIENDLPLLELVRISDEKIFN